VPLFERTRAISLPGTAAHRHPGHLDALRDESELWNDELLTPLGVGPLIEVDTTGPVDIDALAQEITALAASP
jgi:hypothetical protein